MKSSKSLRRLQQQLAESREQPITADEMFRPPAVAGRDTPAMDSTLSGYVSAMGDSAIAQMPPFVGYANLAILATHPLIRGGIEPMADEMVKKWIEFKIEKVEDEVAPEPKSVLMAMAEGKDPDQFEQDAADDAAKNDEKTIQKLKTAFEARKIQHHFRWAAATGHYQGGAVLFIDMGDDPNSEQGKAELQTPLVVNKGKIKPGMFKGLRQVEPVYIYPGPYNSTQPLSADFYEPEHWYVMGTAVHRSRLLFFIPNPLSVLFRPAYNFFGISTSQLVWEYVETFDEVRADGAQIIKKFRMHVLATDMSQAMQENASPEQIRTIGQRAEIFNTAADNFGVLLLDKDSEEYAQHNTPITGLPEIASKHLEFVATMFKMPAVKLLGIEPSGFNSTGDADRNNWFDNIAAHQEKLFRDPLETVNKIIQLDVFGEIDSRIAFDFPPLQEMTEIEQAQNQKTKAETGKSLIDAGVITAEEERRRVASDPNSGYNSIDPGSVPEPPPAPTLPPEFLDGQDVPEQAQDAVFKEQDHPRDKDGKFSTASQPHAKISDLKVKYHGTPISPNSKFSKFKQGGVNPREPIPSKGIYFANQESTAKQYGDVIKERYLSMGKTLLLDTPEKTISAIKTAKPQIENEAKKAKVLLDDEAFDKVIEIIREDDEGTAGVIQRAYDIGEKIATVVRNGLASWAQENGYNSMSIMDEDRGDTYIADVVFSPEQIHETREDAFIGNVELEKQSGVSIPEESERIYKGLIKNKNDEAKKIRSIERKYKPIIEGIDEENITALMEKRVREPVKIDMATGEIRYARSGERVENYYAYMDGDKYKIGISKAWLKEYSRGPQ